MRTKSAAIGALLATTPLFTGLNPTSLAASPVAEPLAPAPWSRVQPNVDASLPCLNEAIPADDKVRQIERFRTGFGLSPSLAADGTEPVELLGIQLTPVEHAQVLRQLEYQSQAGIHESAVAAMVGEYYGGVKICHDRGGVVQILVKRDAESQPDGLAGLNRRILADFGKFFPIELREVEFSLADLQALRDSLERVRAPYFNETGSAIRSIQVDIEHNQVRVGSGGTPNLDVLADLLDEDLAERTLASDTRFSTRLPIENVEQTGNVEDQVNVEMMRAGNKIARSNQILPYCTSSVTLGFSGWPETLTSGHCFGWNARSNQTWRVVGYPSFGHERRNYFGTGGSVQDIGTITQDKLKLANCIQMTAGNNGICKPAVGAKNPVVNGVIWMSGANNNVNGPFGVGWVTRGLVADFYIPSGVVEQHQCINGWLGVREDCYISMLMEANYDSEGGDSGAPVYGVTPSGFNPVYAGMHKGRSPLDGGTARFVPWSEIWSATRAYIWNVSPSAHIPGAP